VNGSHEIPQYPKISMKKFQKKNPITQIPMKSPLNVISSSLVDGLEHDFYDFPYIGNNHPN